MAILEMKNIRKAFSGEEILKGISLSCKEGEVLSIIGPSGSGKSTLLRIATLLEKAEGGELFYDGKAIFVDGRAEKTGNEVRKGRGQEAFRSGVSELQSFSPLDGCEKCDGSPDSRAEKNKGRSGRKS